MTNTRVNEIDLLRFFAALAVVFFHYAFRGYAADGMSVMPYPLLASTFKYGYLGVELFFMISGFVILMTAAGGSLRGFAISRIVRLYPAFWACCTITFLVIVFFGEPHFTASIGQYLVNMTMLSDFVGVPSIDGAYWSLFVEIRFYALVAIVLIIGRIHQAQMFLFVWLLASIALEIYPVGVLRYLLIADYAAFFIAGATFFLIWSKGVTSARLAIISMSLGLGIVESVGKLQKMEHHYHTSMNAYVVAGVIAIFFAIMMLVALRRTGYVGRTRWLLAGVLTYPLYLLHQNIGYIIFNAGYPTVNSHVLFWGTVLLAIAAAYVVHVLVEKKFTYPMKVLLNQIADRLQRLVIRSGERVEVRH